MLAPDKAGRAVRVRVVLTGRVKVVLAGRVKVVLGRYFGRVPSLYLGPRKGSWAASALSLLISLKMKTFIQYIFLNLNDCSLILFCDALIFQITQAGTNRSNRCVILTSTQIYRSSAVELTFTGTDQSRLYSVKSTQHVLCNNCRFVKSIHLVGTVHSTHNKPQLTCKPGIIAEKLFSCSFLYQEN